MSAAKTPEGRLVARVVELQSLMAYPDQFLAARDAFKSAFIADCKRCDWHCFDSVFLSDLIAFLQHRKLRDFIPDQEHHLRKLQEHLALRKLQAGEWEEGMGLVAELAGEPIAHDILALDATANRHGDANVTESVLSVGLLTKLASTFGASHPRITAVLEELSELLRSDPTYTHGSAITILLHHESGSTNPHTGYGIASVVQAVAEPKEGTTYAFLGRHLITGADGDFGTAVLTGLQASDQALQHSGNGSGRILQGLNMWFTLAGMQEIPTGESAGLAFALHNLSAGASCGRRETLAPYPGTAAIGRVDIDGNIHAVASGPSLQAKLGRVWESGVQRLFVPKEQEQECQEILRGFGNPILPKREVELIGIESLRECAPDGMWQRSRTPFRKIVLSYWRRHRVAMTIALTFLALLVGALVYSLLPRNITGAFLHDGRLEVELNPWLPDSHQLQSVRGFIKVPDERVLPHPLILDLDSDGHQEIITVSVDTDQPSRPVGAVRVDLFRLGWFSRLGGPRWTANVTHPVRYREREGEYEDRYTPEVVMHRDWDGDGEQEIFIVSNHTFFPSLLTVLNARGDVEFELISAGHIEELLFVPPVLETRPNFGISIDPAARCSDCSFLVASYHVQETPCGGLMLLWPGMNSGQTPAEKLRYQMAGNVPVTPAAYVQIPASAPALLTDSSKNWPGYLIWHPADSTIGISTEEIARGGTLLRSFDRQLNQVQVVPADVFLSKYKEMKRNFPELGPIDGEDTRRSIETVLYWRNETWTPQRHPAW